MARVASSADSAATAAGHDGRVVRRIMAEAGMRLHDLAPQLHLEFLGIEAVFRIAVVVRPCAGFECMQRSKESKGVFLQLVPFHSWAPSLTHVIKSSATISKSS